MASVAIAAGLVVAGLSVTPLHTFLTRGRGGGFAVYRLRAEHRGHIPVMLASRECPAIDVSRKLTSEDVLVRLSDLFVRRVVPDHIRSDDGPEFTATRVREWLAWVGVTTLDIERGSPEENGYTNGFHFISQLTQKSPRARCSQATTHRDG